LLSRSHLCFLTPQMAGSKGINYGENYGASSSSRQEKHHTGSYGPWMTIFRPDGKHVSKFNLSFTWDSAHWLAITIGAVKSSFPIYQYCRHSRSAASVISLNSKSPSFSAELLTLVCTKYGPINQSLVRNKKGPFVYWLEVEIKWSSSTTHILKLLSLPSLPQSYSMESDWVMAPVSM